MTSLKEIGIIEKSGLKKTYEETQIEWRIPDFSTIVAATDNNICYKSPAFSINDISYFFELYPKSALNNDFTRLYLCTTVKQDVSTKYKLFMYNVSLRKLDGSMIYLTSGILKIETEELWFAMGNIIKRSELQRRKSELESQNAFTIICTLTYEITQSTHPIASSLTPLKLIRLDKLSKNFKDLFTDKETCDVTLKVQEKEYKAHRSVLIARSSVFAATFKHDTLERQTGVITIPDCDPDSFTVFLEYLYSGELEEISSCNALNLYYAADKYDIPELKTFCMEYMMQHLTTENICEVAVLADKYEETELLIAVQDFFNKNIDKIFVTAEWQSFMIKENRLANKFLIEMSKVKVKD